MTFTPGQKVHYIPAVGEPENGIVKIVHPHNPKTVFVVYKCNKDQSNYKNYTAAATSSIDLRDGWIDYVTKESE
jgi:hypothetical protein